ncbi:sugar phosphate isomerase/epimerase family protein [Sphingosinicella sp.]|uniref:sugar phosphate isomerase/epimerase family protein n=1 Tax=Sphingosinicella sp. TaxID=1917971 RepID=UPI00403823DE
MRIRPSIRLSLLPAALPFRERLALAAEAGFEGVEVEADSGPPAEIRDAADRAGLIVHSVHSLAHCAGPLSSGDPAVLAAAIKTAIATIEAAHILGAGTMLLIPGRVAADSTYGEVYDRSHDVISREILPVAAQHGIVLGIENVWNGFLLSPIDYAQYVDGFGSPWVRAYLDLGNIIFGRPEGWIDLLGPRICSLHLKDLWFDLPARRFGFAKIGEGDIDWPSVRSALGRVGYDGWGVLAEAELALSPMGRRLYCKTVGRPPPRAVPALRAPLAAAQIFLVRRLLRDLMGRFRHHIRPAPALSAVPSENAGKPEAEGISSAGQRPRQPGQHQDQPLGRLRRPQRDARQGA